MRYSIGFLTPFKHLPEFTKYAFSKCKIIDITSIKKEEINYFKGIDFLFAAPNYLNYSIEEHHIKDTNLKGILSPSTGINHINVKSIPVISIKKDKVLESITSTAEHNLYLMLSILRQTNNIQELSELNLGILGYGRLGKILHNICKPIFKKISICDIDYMHENFFEDTDILSINIDLTEKNIKGVKFGKDVKDQNGNIIDFKVSSYTTLFETPAKIKANMANGNIDKFNKKLFIVNTARGEVVNEDELLDQIYEGKVLGYATDVIKEEYSGKATNIKITSDYRIIRTPHIGGTALQAQEKAYKRTLEKLLSYEF
jgi:lactate dehydrogenase-like 2-hydroxyacid dehydrogenase